MKQFKFNTAFVFLLVLLFTLLSSVKAQNSELDSLIRAAKNYKSSCNNSCLSDSAFVNTLDKISWNLKSLDLDSALHVANQALELAQKIKWKKGTARAYTQKSLCLRYLGQIDEALKVSETSVKTWEELIQEDGKNRVYKSGRIKALYQVSSALSAMGKYVESLQVGEKIISLAEEINDKKLMAGQIGNNGEIYSVIGNYAKASDCYFESIKIFEELGEMRSAAINYGSIGYLFLQQKENDKAIEYMQKGINAAEKINELALVGELYSEMSDAYAQKKMYDKAIENSERALKIVREIGFKSMEIHTMGALCRYNTIIGDYKKALQWGDSSLVLAKEANIPISVANALNDLGECKLKMKNYPEAEAHLLEAIKIAKEAQSPSTLKSSEEIIFQLYAKTRNFEQALSHYQNFITLKDSIYNDETNRKLMRNEMSFEYDKKTAILKEQQEKEKLIAEEKSFIQKIIIAGVALVLIIVLFFTYMVLKSLKLTRQQKEIIELKEKETTEQNKIIIQQKHIVEEKQQEILDSINYAKRIQYTLLAHADFLQENIPNHFVYFNPKDIVSGDFYWATKRGNKFYLAVCDSTGHGVPGAFMSLLNISFLNEAVNEKGIEEPNKVFDFVRQRLIDNISKEGQKDGFDGILVCIDKSNNNITYAAANNAPVLIKTALRQAQGPVAGVAELVEAPQFIELEADRMPVGMGERKENFKLFSIDAQKGDSLYLYTDGYADQFGGPKGKKFKYKQLNELIVTNCQKPLNEQKEILRNTFENWRGNLEQVDDVCIIGIRL